MEVRDTTEEDAECLAALIDSVARERRYLAGTVGFPVDSTRAFIASVKAAGGVHIVAVALGKVIGWCDIIPHTFEGMQHVGRASLSDFGWQFQHPIGRVVPLPAGLQHRADSFAAIVDGRVQ